MRSVAWSKDAPGIVRFFARTVERAERPSMLLGIVGTLIFALTALGASIVAFPHLRSDETWTGIAARLLIGSAIVVVVLHVLVQFVPVAVAGWGVTGVIIAGVLLTRVFAYKRAVIQPRRARFRLEMTFVLVLLGLALWRLWPVLSIGYLTTFEGTGNHDEVHYVLVAEWLLHHPAMQPISLDPDLPFASAAQVALRVIPRYGAELVLASLSAVAGLATFEAYPVTMTAGALLWMCAAALLLASIKHEVERTNALALAIAAISPVAAYIAANSNLATLFGCAFLAGYSCLLLRSIEPDSQLRDAAAAGILLGAISVSYGEVIPLAAIVTAVTFGYALYGRTRDGAWARLRPFVVAGTVALLVAPFAVIDTVRLILVNIGIVGNRLSAPNWNSMYEGRGPARAVLTTMTLAPELMSALPATVAGIVAAAVIAVVGSRTTKRLLYCVAPLLIAGMALLYFAFVTDFGYGKMKAIQMLSIPLTVVVGLPVARALLEVDKRTWRSVATAAGSIVVVGFMAYVAATTFAVWRNVALAKHASRDLVQLETVAPLLPPDAEVFVSDHLGSYTFMNSRWIALFMRDTKLIFAPEIQGGGYLHGLERGYEERLQKVTHVLTATKDNLAVPKPEAATFHNQSFQILPLPAAGGFAEFEAGFHGDEGGTRWMDQTARIRVFGAGARGLRIAFPYRYPGASGKEEVTVLTQTGGYVLESKGGVGFMEILIPMPRMGNDQVFSLTGGAGVIEVPLGKFAVQDVEIRSGLVATSPSERGQSSDPRKLSFRVGRIEVMP